MKTTIDYQQLSGLQIFRNVENNILDQVIQQSQLIHLPQEQFILRSGQNNHAIYVLLEGLLDVYLEKHTEAISRIFPGQVFGEISMLDKQAVSASVLAKQDSIIIKLEETLVWQLIEQSHHFSHNMILILAARLRSFSEQVSNAENNKRNLLADNIDTTTGLYNRNWFEHYFPQEFEQAKLQKSSLTLMMLQIKTDKATLNNALHQLSNTLQLHFRGFQHFSRFDDDKLAAIISRCELAEVKALCQSYAEQHNSDDFQLLFCFSQQTPVDTVTSLIEKDLNLLQRADKKQSNNQVLDWSAFAG